MGCCRFANRCGGRVLGIVTAVSLATTSGFAQATGPDTRAAAPVTVQGGRAGVSHGLTVSGTAIVGSAWRADNTPIPYAKVRLRNVVSGRIEATAQADDTGQFLFDKVGGGSYLVELVNDSGKVLAVSHPFTLANGETIATFVRLGTKVPWFDGFFASAALAVAAGAAAAGLTAVAPEQVRPVSGRQ
jgi:hypothetical protein